MRHKRGFYEVAPVAGFIARQDWTHMMERAERNGLSLQSQKGSTGLLFSVRILARSEEHTSELQSLMRISYAVFCLKKKERIEHEKKQ